MKSSRRETSLNSQSNIGNTANFIIVKASVYEKVKEKSKYNLGFIAKIKKGDRDKKSGNYRVIKTEDLWK
jgi:hypothetical protein